MGKFIMMQLIKGYVSLRLSNKYDKPVPCCVYTHGSQDNMIKRYDNHVELVKELM